jgi:hypothetical protein
VCGCACVRGESEGERGRARESLRFERRSAESFLCPWDSFGFALVGHEQGPAGGRGEVRGVIRAAVSLSRSLWRASVSASRE